jgi:hypothetical protein
MATEEEGDEEANSKLVRLFYFNIQGLCFNILISPPRLLSGPRPGGLTLRLRDSWGTEVRGWSSLALGGVG